MSSSISALLAGHRVLSAGWRERKAGSGWPQSHRHVHTEFWGSWVTARGRIRPMNIPMAVRARH